MSRFQTSSRLLIPPFRVQSISKRFDRRPSANSKQRPGPFQPGKGSPAGGRPRMVVNDPTPSLGSQSKTPVGIIPERDQLANPRPRAAAQTSGARFASGSPKVAVGVTMMGLAMAAASSSLFLIPPPLTNGRTATACRPISFRRSGKSGSKEIPSRPASRESGRSG